MPFTVFEFWENEYILDSPHLQNEPTSEHLAKLCAMLFFLGNAGTGYESLDSYDWLRLRELVDENAIDIPADVLQYVREPLINHGE